MRKFLINFARDEEGATAIEYGLIAALIAVPVIAYFTNIGTRLQVIFGNILTALGGTAPT